ncbi:isochorismatase family protein [Amycolatopsis acidicola]|uniref:Isochorismatase family protein n=1 Tax=Amycolatopsis acidicola TaxID=2596893 RepID=A0A5N0VK88_9PSEU|nr:isochorismatase family cysteine hydrolase [Amycolatopsis acidicola]KAA9166118.1 isochorismatase family protein [Amycolatopsis acidicola]
MTGSALATPHHPNRWSFEDGRVDLRRPHRPPRPTGISALPAPLTADLARSALIVVDMQNDFCAEGGWLHGIGVDVSPLAGAITAVRDLVPAARAAGVPVVWVNWGNREDQANLPPGVSHVYDPDGRGTGVGARLPNGSRVLTKGSWGAALVDGLGVAPGDIEVDKYRMSGFWDTPLDSILRNLRVDTLFFAGVNSDQCVYSTLVDAACLGYDVVLVDGASATTSPAFCHEATLYNTRQCYGFSTPAAELLAAFTKDAS